MSDSPASAGLSSHSDPAQEQTGKPARRRIIDVLTIVSILAIYGRHLARTLERRAAARGFATIARYFGTAKIETIAAHLQRGLMRVIALESILLTRAMRGGELPIEDPRERSCRAAPGTAAAVTGREAGSAAPKPLTPEQEQEAAALAAEIAAEKRLARRIARDQPLTLATLPCMKAIIAEVRRSPVGRTIAAICRDFGISPALCNGLYWTELFDSIRLHRGNASGLVLDIKRRERRFAKEDWKHPGLELPEETREGIRRVLGFFIGLPPVWPFAVAGGPGVGVAAAATGPP